MTKTLITAAAILTATGAQAGLTSFMGDGAAYTRR